MAYGTQRDTYNEDVVTVLWGKESEKWVVWKNLIDRTARDPGGRYIDRFEKKKDAVKKARKYAKAQAGKQFEGAVQIPTILKVESKSGRVLETTRYD